MDGIDDYNEKMFKKIQQTAKLEDNEQLIVFNEKQRQEFEDMLNETKDID